MIINAVKQKHKMKVKYIYWFANFNLFSPSVRYRGKYVLEYVEKHYQINNSFVFPGYKIGNILKFIGMVFEVLFFRKQNSVIVVQNIYTNRIYSSVLKLLLVFRHRNTIYDIDDANYERYPAETINYFMRKCEACSVGSLALLNYAKAFNKNTFLLTSPIILHFNLKTIRNKTLTIGWIGFFSAHKASLYKYFLPALGLINFPIKLVILGITKSQHKTELINYYSNNLHIELEICTQIDWCNETGIYDKIAKFDVGISTLLDNELDRAKSAFKLKQYMSCGVPVLGSSKGENVKFLKHGINGYICETVEEFKDRIEAIKMLGDGEYFELCANARKSYAEFSIQNYCDTWFSLFENK